MISTHPQGQGVPAWSRTRGGKIVLLGALGLLLQQVAAPYTATLGGMSANASLLHLHYGLLLAIAMLDRDHWVVAGTYALVMAGWVLRATLQGYDMRLWLPIGLLVMPFTLAWILLCARWTGRPRPPGESSVSKPDLARFAFFGLLAFPLGSALISLAVGWALGNPERWLGFLQLLFARYFGVAVLALPLVMAWCEGGSVRDGVPRRWGWLWPLLLALGLAAAAAAGDHLAVLSAFAREHSAVFMDYRFALFALLAWCVLNLDLRTSMLLLSMVLFAWVQMLTGTAERNGTALGFVNLAYLAFEVAVLLVSLLYFAIFERDAREFSARLEREARRDAATGLPNLAALRHSLDGPGALPAKAEVGFLLLDDTDHLVEGFGLDIQAEVMKAAAARLAGMARPFMLGAGQFVLLPLGEGARTVDWGGVLDAVNAIEMDAGGSRFGLSPYLGVARWMDDAAQPVEAIVLKASQQAFEARRRREVRPLYASDGPAPAEGLMRRRLQAATGALAGIRSGRLELHFQPIRPLHPDHPVSGTPPHAVGEVLCRLRDCDGGLLAPDAFLGPIESVGRSVELDLAVVRTLFTQVREQPRALPGIRRMGVNLTGHSMASSSFRRQFEQLLADSPLPLAALCFEVSEAAAISAVAHARGFLEELRRQGCLIAIDDFGTGMQSFARLREIPADILKIDGSFIRNLASSPTDQAVVEASVSIARAFGFTTVAEYVETEETAQRLRELGVEWMQGYLYGKPRPLAEVLAEGAGSARAADAQAVPQSPHGSHGTG